MGGGRAPVVCCLGGSDADSLALDGAVRLARCLGHPLSTVHATSDRDRLGRTALEGVESAGVVLSDAVVIADEGDAAAAVCAWAESEGVEVLAATPRRGALVRVLLGGFTTHLAEKAPCDVLIARPTEHAEGPPPGRPVLVEDLVEDLVEALDPAGSLREAVGRLERVGCTLPVVDASGVLVGLLGRPEVIAAVSPPEPVNVSGTRVPPGDDPQLVLRAQRGLEGRVGEQMRAAVSARAGDAVTDVLLTLARERVDALPVVDAWSQVTGILRAGTVLRALADAGAADPAARDRTGATFSHIACCVDDSPAALSALGRAAALREGAQATLTVVHATDRPGDAEAAATARRLLDEGAARTGADTALLHGDPGVAVERWAAEAGVDLLVVAAHRGPTARPALGGFAGHLARNAPCPVLLVRRMGPPGP